LDKAGRTWVKIGIVLQQAEVLQKQVVRNLAHVQVLVPAPESSQYIHFPKVTDVLKSVRRALIPSATSLKHTLGEPTLLRVGSVDAGINRNSFGGHGMAAQADRGTSELALRTERARRGPADTYFAPVQNVRVASRHRAAARLGATWPITPPSGAADFSESRAAEFSWSQRTTRSHSGCVGFTAQAPESARAGPATAQGSSSAPASAPP
jgi:hypothetical protein